MMGYEASELESMQDEEAVQAPEPRAPEPRAPVPEPGLDLSLSPSPSPSPLPESPRRRPERAGQWGGARRGRQVRFRLAPLSPVRSERSEPLGDAASGPQTLEAPALQSSLALGLELQAARAAVAQFDASKAAEEQLSRVERAALQAALPGPGEPAGAGGTGSEGGASGEAGIVAAAAGPGPAPEGATRAGARHDHPLRPRHSVLRGSAPDGGRIAPPAAASADPPVRGHLPHA
ncbi:protein phosphatase 1 regulatory subunit 35 isoform X4 [Nannospalax galili]|uniref:protein phosphatase 1 regulatory subunit 35 isoform X4 n=1 Tax=Nannospalax galili TaxID=1026970 RepID=UPI00111C7075|nr:protein phosphatase 1 regulatory subunit 35 isoform X4 [Nannospalax galili]